MKTDAQGRIVTSRGNIVGHTEISPHVYRDNGGLDSDVDDAIRHEECKNVESGVGIKKTKNKSFH